MAFAALTSLTCMRLPRSRSLTARRYHAWSDPANRVSGVDAVALRGSDRLHQLANWLARRLTGLHLGY